MIILLVVGLGNVGSKFEKTLHNVGFLALDFLDRVGPHQDLMDLGGLHTTVSFFKPSTGMNLSGHEIAKTLKYHNLTASDLIVTHDDIDIPFGEVKKSYGSGSGGHRGVQNIIEVLGTKDFWRIRIGVRPSSYNSSLHKAEDFVLTNFSKAQLLTLNTKTFPAISSYLKQIIGSRPIARFACLNFFI